MSRLEQEAGAGLVGVDGNLAVVSFIKLQKALMKELRGGQLLTVGNGRDRERRLRERRIVGFEVKRLKNAVGGVTRIPQALRDGAGFGGARHDA